MTANEKPSSASEKMSSDEKTAHEPNQEYFEDINELSVEAEGEERTTWFVWALVASSTISGLLFGKPDPAWRMFIHWITVVQATTQASYLALWSLLALT